MRAGSGHNAIFLAFKGFWVRQAGSLLNTATEMLVTMCTDAVYHHFACCPQVTAMDVTDDILERARRRAEAAGPATSDSVTFVQVRFLYTASCPMQRGDTASACLRRNTVLYTL